MDTPIPGPNAPLPARGSECPGVLRRLVRTVPTGVVFLTLVGVAYWGHTTGWAFTGGKPGAGPSKALSEEPRPVVRMTTAAPGHGPEHYPHGRLARIEFTSAAQVETAGIDITPVWTTALIEQVTSAGEVQFDPARVARLSARAGGVAHRVLKAPGESVRGGEVLALVESVEVGKAKAVFRQALVQVRFREKERDDLVRAKAAASPAQVREAEAVLKEAEVRLLAAAQALTNLGLPARPADYRDLTPAETVRRMWLLGVEGTADLDPATTTANLLPVRTPFAGTVLSADLVTGETVEAGNVLFTVADPSRVWVTLHVTPEDARRVAAGQKVFFRPDGSVREHPGAVVWVGATADETTRSVPVRAEADNAGGLLRASTLGRGRVVLREEPKAVVVPHDAVRPFRGRSVVFVRDPGYLKPAGPKAFDVRVVRTGGRDERHTEILAGVSPGEIVAVKGSDVLLGELARAQAAR